MTLGPKEAWVLADDFLRMVPSWAHWNIEDTKALFERSKVVLVVPDDGAESGKNQYSKDHFVEDIRSHFKELLLGMGLVVPTGDQWTRMITMEEEPRQPYCRICGEEDFSIPPRESWKKRAWTTCNGLGSP